MNTNKCDKMPRYFPWLLVIIGAIAYINAMDGPFIYDDHPSIVENKDMRVLWPPSRLFSGPDQSTVAGRPLICLSLALNYAADGMNVRGYHAVNLAVHLACALLLFGVIRRTLHGPLLRPRFEHTADGLALACALLWVVHPVLSECVNYIVLRTESMMGLFYLLTFYCVIRADDSANRSRWTVSAVLACAAGMASKEAMVTAPMMIVLYDLAFRTGSIRDTLHRRWPLYAALASTWIILATIMATGPRSDSVGFTLGTSGLQYAMNQCLMISGYFRMAFWPYPLSIDHGVPRVLTVGQVAPYALIVVALLVATLIVYIRRPAIGFGAVWFFVALSPTSSFVPIATEVGAERRMYLSLAGLIVVTVIGGYLLITRWCATAKKQSGNRLAIGIAAVVIVILTITTLNRNEDYNTTVSIWNSATQATPHNPRTWSNLGEALAAQNNLARAVAQYEKALDLDPDFLEAHVNLGDALTTLARYEEAIDHCRQAIGINPYSAQAYNNWGAALYRKNDLDGSVAQYRKALEIDRDHAEANFNMGTSLLKMGNLQQAAEHFRRVLRAQPDDAETQRILRQLKQ